MINSILEIKKKNINFFIDRSILEGVKDIDMDIFPSHFLGLICGSPGSGKTSLLKFMLKNEYLLYKKFDEIIILSPSIIEFNELFLPKENLCSELNWQFLYDRIAQLNNKNNSYTNVLLIIDDFISELQKERSSVDIRKIIFNRRHLLKNGMISILLTSQKFSLVPTPIRSNLTVLFTFQLNNICIERLKKDIIREDTNNFNQIIKYVFDTYENFMIYRIDKNLFYKNFNLIKI